MNNTFFDGVGTALLVGYLGYLFGYVGAWILFAIDPSRDIDPLRVGEHGAALVGFVAVATTALVFLR